MRRWLGVALVLCGVGSTAVGQYRDPVIEVFKAQSEIEKRLLANDLTALEKAQGELSDASFRLLRLGDDLIRAEREGEDVSGLQARSADIARAEAEVARLIGACQMLRTAIGVRRSVLEQMQAEIRRLEEASQASQDELSGRWSVAIEPGGLRGAFDLRLDGTLVTGVYQLAGGWKGSLRGTLIGEIVRLERIDTQQGFVAVYSGRLVVREGSKRIEGSWEATNLAAGMPAGGSWVARREPR
ncbi:MAG: hypothetical protein KA072_11965 [Thermoanaerobaculaceae bacterium]|nr:hypothetical protein [Thermoanaerobaculaceae bacterium]MDI9621655.1 hypothetical protein [Acidobacteriota bacterium]NLH10763.1 hypothetical protein [Holophagae bacterium]HPW55972.1 hypothetical protein [Thermoanaerobaculaceae bacterium]